MTILINSSTLFFVNNFIINGKIYLHIYKFIFNICLLVLLIPHTYIYLSILFFLKLKN